MKRLFAWPLAVIAALLFAPAVYATTPVGYVAVTGTQIVDSTGTAEANGTICFAPVNAIGVGIGYQINGHGHAVSTPVCALVTAGTFSIQLADTALTAPQNVCFGATVIDNVSGKSILGAGYGCVQPAGSGVAVTGTQAWCTAAGGGSGGACNFDLYVPNMGALVVQQAGTPGPTGPAGPASTVPGPAGPAGPPYTGVTSDGASGLAVSGAVTAAKVNTTIYIAPSGDTSCVADSAAVAAVAASGGAVQLGTGTYYIDGIVISAQHFKLTGNGPENTVVNKCGAAGYAFTVNTDWPGSGNVNTSVLIRDFTLNQKSGVTPTAGGGFTLFDNTSGHYVTGAHIKDIHQNGVWNGFDFESGTYINWLDGDLVSNPVNQCLVYNTPSPGGDNNLDGLSCRGPAGGVTIAQADTTEFTNLKLNGAGLTFTGAGVTANVRFNNASIEGTSTLACGITFAVGAHIPTAIAFTGGEFNTFVTASVCNPAGASYSITNAVDLTTNNASGNPLLSGTFFALSYFSRVGANCSSITPFCSGSGGYAYVQLGGTGGGPSGLTFSPINAGLNAAQSWIYSASNGLNSSDIRMAPAKTGNTALTQKDGLFGWLLRVASSNTYLWNWIGGSISLGSANLTDPGDGNLNAAGDVKSATAHVTGAVQLSGITGHGTAGEVQSDASGNLSQSDLFNGWANSTPTPTCGSGTPTTISSNVNVQTISKTAFINLTIHLTTLGTCATGFVLALPVVAVSGQPFQSLACMETTISGTAVSSFIAGGSQNLTLRNYSNATSGLMLQSGAIVTCSGALQIN